MILSGREIERFQGNGIVIDPFNPAQVNPNSYNLRLHNMLMVYTGDVLDMKTPNPTRTIEIPESGFKLEPGNLYLGRTLEYTVTDRFIPMLEGRSSVGRLGLCIHVTAGFGDVGFAGFWTLEMFCVKPVIIYPYVEICQIYYHEIAGDYDLYTSGKYSNNSEVQASKMYMDFDK